jgi:hypothetical protein
MKIDPERLELTESELKRYFTYDPMTGEFKRILRRTRWQGDVPCSELITGKNNRGYYWVKINRHMYLVHRLIVLYMTGVHPRGEVDHINGDRLDNRWGNLRDTSPFENSRNQGNREDNTSGCRGVTFSKNSDKWVARISHQGVRYSLGYFPTKEEAIEARKEAEQRFGYHPNHARRESWRG